MDAQQPDKYDRAFFFQQIHGLGVRANRVEHEWNNQYESLAALIKRVEALEAARREDMATIGELKGEITALNGRLDEAGKYIARVAKEKNGHAVG